MKILGIDPGSITTGYAFLEAKPNKIDVLEYGIIHAPANKNLEDRLLKIITQLEELLDKYTPDALAMEGVFFAKNPKSALVLGHIRGAILVACKKRNMSYNEYSPRSVKQAITGNGAASKEQVETMIFAHLGIDGNGLPLDASDALAIAYTHATPAPLTEALKTKRTSKKASVKAWENLILNAGGKLP